MKTMKTIIAALFIFALFTTSNAIAQEGPYFTVTTWKIDIPENGTNAEFNSLMKEFNQKIVQPNTKIISERVMRHASGSDSRDLVIITEYANWNDIDAAATMQGELMETAWGNEAGSKAFFEKFNKYFIMHTDQIYKGMVGQDKK